MSMHLSRQNLVISIFVKAFLSGLERRVSRDVS